MRRLPRSTGVAVLALLVSPSLSASGVELAPRADVAAVPRPEIGLGVLQLVTGYALEIGGTAGLIGVGLSPKNLGFRSDEANAAFVGVVVPVLAGTAVCATGLLSSRYRGRCGTTILGAYTGAAAFALLGVLLAPSPGPDDTAAFMKSMYAIVGFLVGAPIGAVVGYHLTKESIASEREDNTSRTPVPVPVGRLSPPADAPGTFGERARSGVPGNVPPRLMVPLLSFAW